MCFLNFNNKLPWSPLFLRVLPFYSGYSQNILTSLNRVFKFWNCIFLLLMFYFMQWIITNKWKNRAIGLMSRVFTNGPGDWGSIPGRFIPKTQKMVLDAALLSTQNYNKVRMKGKIEQSWEWSSTLPYTSV